MRRALIAAVAALALAPASAAAQEHHGGPPPDGADISIGYADFSPARVDVLAGDPIHWANASVRRHDVAAVDASFNSGILGAGAAFSRTFASGG